MDLRKNFGDLSIEEELLCPICLERLFNPVSLPCLHSFCFDCIKDVRTFQREGRDDVKIQCPECRKKVHLPGGSFENLPKNFRLANIIAKIEEGRKRSEKKKIERRHLMCPEHKEWFGLFCMKCYCPLCLQCHPEHEKHRVKNIREAHKSCMADLRNMLLPQLSELRSVFREKCHELEDAHHVEMNRFQNKYQEIKNKYDKEIAHLQAAKKKTSSKLRTELISTRRYLETLHELDNEAMSDEFKDPTLKSLKIYADLFKRIQKNVGLNQDTGRTPSMTPRSAEKCSRVLRKYHEKFWLQIHTGNQECGSSAVTEKHNRPLDFQTDHAQQYGAPPQSRPYVRRFHQRYSPQPTTDARETPTDYKLQERYERDFQRPSNNLQPRPSRRRRQLGRWSYDLDLI